MISTSTDVSFFPTKYHDCGVYVGFWITTSASTWFFYQGTLCLVLILAVVIATPSEYRNTTSFVLIDFRNTGNWTNNGWAWCLGFLTSVWIVAGFETSNAQKVVVFAMVSSLIVPLFVCAGITIALMFTMDNNVPALLQSHFEQPVGPILYNCLGKNGAVTFVFFLSLGFLYNCTNIFSVASRNLLAFCRDGGFPFSGYLRALTPWKAPIRCVWACCLISMIVRLLMLANTAAILSIFSTAVIAPYSG